MDACRDVCTYIQTYEDTIKDACVSTCMDYHGSACIDVSNEITGVNQSTCPYIYTKGTGVHGFTPTENSKKMTDARDITNVYDD